MIKSFRPGSSDVFLVIDVQNDFCSGGNLAVPDGEAVVPVINRLAEAFEHVVLAQDWHPKSHGSFASTHPGKAAINCCRFHDNSNPQVAGSNTFGRASN